MLIVTFSKPHPNIVQPHHHQNTPHNVDNLSVDLFITNQYVWNFQQESHVLYILGRNSIMFSGLIEPEFEASCDICHIGKRRVISATLGSVVWYLPHWEASCDIYRIKKHHIISATLGSVVWYLPHWEASCDICHIVTSPTESRHHQICS